MCALWVKTGVAICGISLLMSACATRTKQAWLLLFFDGVPVEGVEDVQGDTIEASPRPTRISRAVLFLAQQKESLFQFVHDPFATDDCTDCHESNHSQRMKGPLIDVCFECHDDFLTDVASHHEPAAVGDCMDCHEPHESIEPALLLMPMQSMCYECHDTYVANIVHEPAAVGDCQGCHDAHSSQFSDLLLLPEPHLCYECHEAYEAEFVHDPVAAGCCQDCHDPHESEFPGLLVMPDPAVCYECHEEGEVVASDAHVNIDPVPCSRCHDPHEGTDPYFLKDGVRHAPWTD